jgi:hypothetical protein
MTAFRCPCCGLQQASTVGGTAFHRCARCAEHADTTIEELAARDAEHAAMYQHALIDAQDETLLAQRERDHYRTKMQAAYSSREVLVQVLSQIDDVHRAHGKRCSCGRRNCPVATLLADPRVARLISTYDEVRRTLRELRAANPDRWIEKWDYIDVSLVYPSTRSGRGRHRAAG